MDCLSRCDVLAFRLLHRGSKESFVGFSHFFVKSTIFVIICHNSMVIQNIIRYQWEGVNWFVDLIEKKSNGSRQCSWPRWSL